MTCCELPGCSPLARASGALSSPPSLSLCSRQGSSCPLAARLFLPAFVAGSSSNSSQVSTLRSTSSCLPACLSRLAVVSEDVVPRARAGARAYLLLCCTVLDYPVAVGLVIDAPSKERPWLVLVFSFLCILLFPLWNWELCYIQLLFVSRLN